LWCRRDSAATTSQRENVEGKEVLEPLEEGNKSLSAWLLRWLGEAPLLPSSVKMFRLCAKRVGD
jgi:hypothetical protein